MMLDGNLHFGTKKLKVENETCCFKRFVDEKGELFWEIAALLNRR